MKAGLLFPEHTTENSKCHQNSEQCNGVSFTKNNTCSSEVLRLPILKDIWTVKLLLTEMRFMDFIRQVIIHTEFISS
jgi:hypothetical protein